MYYRCDMADLGLGSRGNQRKSEYSFQWITWELNPEEGPSDPGSTEVWGKGTLTPAGRSENWRVSDDDCVRGGAGSLILPHILESPETSGTPQHGAKHTHTNALSLSHAHTASQGTPADLWKWGLRLKGQWGRDKYDSGTPRLPKHQIRPNCINNQKVGCWWGKLSLQSKTTR